jgi:hypothetical protein
VQRLEAQERPHLENQGRGVDRLVEEVVGPGLVAPPDCHGIAEGGHHDHRQGRTVHLAQPRARLEAVHAGQANVEQDEVEAPFGQRLHPPLPRLDTRRRVVVQLQEIDQGLSDHGIVVDDEHPGHGRRQCCAADSASQARRAILAGATRNTGSIWAIPPTRARRFPSWERCIVSGRRGF